MADDTAIDRSITVGRDANNSIITSGDGNTVIVYQTVTAAATPRAAGKNPYLGLLAFTELDADRFFGREKMVDILWRRYRDLVEAPPRARATRFLAVYGPSGSGKSSLARAGFLAELARRPVNSKPLRVAVMTPGPDPLGALAAALAVVEDRESDDAVARNRQTLREGRDRGYGGLHEIGLRMKVSSSPLLILIDQFEELYSARPAPPTPEETADPAKRDAAKQDEADRETFVRSLIAAAQRPGGGLSVVITVRSDFLGATQGDSELNTLIAQNGVLVPAMTPDELRRAIVQPAKLAGRESQMDGPAIEQLVAETAGLDGALPLLQFTLVEVWKRMEAGQFASEALDDLGGVGGTLGGQAQELFEALPDGDRTIVKRAFLVMVRLDANGRPTRRRVLLRQLCTDPAIPDDQEILLVHEVLDRFAEPTRRLLMFAGETGGDETVEVAHEAIFHHWDQLKAWIAENASDIHLHARVADAALLWEKGDGSLWRPPELDLLREFEAKPTAALTDAELAFFAASEAAHKAELIAKRRRERGVRIAAGVFLLLALVAAGAGWMAMRQSAQAAVQRANALASTARQAVEAGDSGLALLLSLAAVPPGREDTDGYRQASAAMRSALLNLSELRDLPHPKGVLIASFAAQDQRLLTLATDGKARLWDVATGRLRKIVEGVGNIALSQDQSLFATFGNDRDVLVWNAETGELQATIRGASPAVSASFSWDGRRIAIAWSAETSGVWDAGSGHQLAEFGAWNAPAATQIRFLPFDREVLTTLKDQSIRLWDPVTGAPRGTLPGARAPAPDPLAGSNDGRFAALADTNDLELTLWDLRRRRVIRRGLGSILPDFSPSGDLMVASNGAVAQLFSTADGKLLLDELNHEAGYLRGVRFLPRGENDADFPNGVRESFLTAGTDHTAQLWTRKGRDRSHKPFAGHFGRVLSAEGSASGRLVATASEDTTARIWLMEPRPTWRTALAAEVKAQDVANVLPVGRYGWSNRAPEVESTSVSRNGGRVVTTAQDADSAQVWDTSTGDPVGPLLEAPGIALARLSPDGGQVAWGGTDNVVQVLDLKKDKPRELKGHVGSILEVKFSRDGAWILTRADDQTIRVWNAATGVLLTTLAANKGLGFNLSDDKRLLMAWGLENVHIWDVATGQPLVVIPAPKGIESAHWLPDSRRVFAVTPDDGFIADTHILYGRALRAEACRRKPRNFTAEERRIYGLGASSDPCKVGPSWFRALGVGG